MDRGKEIILRSLRFLALACLAISASPLSAESRPASPVSSEAGAPKLQSAVFAGGCFWCMEPPFDEVEGVLETLSGYTGGHIEDPTYEQVSRGGSGHIEVVKVVYDPAKVSFAELLPIYWRNIDPFDAAGQFCDKGSQYRSAIFYQSAEQKLAAEKSLAALELEHGSAEPVATELLPAAKFYPAETYHQDYYQKNPVRYKYYRWGCGRDQRLQEI